MALHSFADILQHVIPPPFEGGTHAIPLSPFPGLLLGVGASHVITYIL